MVRTLQIRGKLSSLQERIQLYEPEPGGDVLAELATEVSQQLLTRTVLLLPPSAGAGAAVRRGGVT